MTASTRTALVTGATGYIGALLVPRLLDQGWRVRVLTRSRGRLGEVERAGAWADRVSAVEGDVADPADLDRALAGVTVAFYLVHSMDGKGGFVERDRDLATGFAAAAESADVHRIVYLSGLHPDGDLSDHLGSRVEVGEIFLRGGVPAAVLQAGVVLGDGSASFDMMRHLTERLPVMIAPKWARNRIQPIGVDDVLHYLVAAADLPGDVNRSIDIAGPDVLSYAQMMKRYAKVAGLGPRPIIVVPVLSPTLAARWVGTVTPVGSGIARPLVGSLVHEAVASEHDAGSLLGDPPGGPIGFDEAVRRATATLEPRRWRRILGAVAGGVFACAAIGSVLTDPQSRWYQNLDKPAWQPPPAAFPVVWTTLYATITVAATATIAELVEDGEPERARAFAGALAANLVLNTAWSGVFFRLRNLPAATVTAAALAASSADLARRAARTGRGKAVGLGAYAAWCGFATALSAAVARRNR